MTTKPDWCPQEVWDESMDLYDPAAWNIAKAILKAKNDAYEEAARVSESGTGWIKKFHTTNDQPSVLIAQAIRNLKHKTEV